MADDEIRGNSVYQTEEPSQTPSPTEKPAAALEKKPGFFAKYVSLPFSPSVEQHH